MSDTPSKLSGLLSGPDNYAHWLSFLEDKIEREDLLEHIDKDLATLQLRIQTKYPVDSSSSASERFKQTEILDRLEAAHRKTRVIIRESLSQEVLNGLTSELKKGEPKDLIAHLKNRYGVVSRARQAEIWSTLWSTRCTEGEDPTPTLNTLRSLFDSMMEQVLSESIDQREFLEQLRGFILLRALPASFDTTTNDFYNRNILEATSIIATVESTWRRKTQRDEDPVHQAMLAKKGSSQGPKGKRPLAPNGRRYRGTAHKEVLCYRCDHYGHKPETCHFPTRPLRSSANVTDMALNHSVLLQNTAAPTTSGSSLLASLHNHLALLANHSPAIVVDTGATNTFIKDRYLLSNLRPLPEPIPVNTGDHGTVQATATADLKLGNVTIQGAFYTPGMSHNLLATRFGPSYQWIFDENNGKLVDKSTGTPILHASVKNNHYHVRIPSALVTNVPDLALQWHCRFGHVDQKVVWRMGRLGRLGKEWTSSFNRFQCNECIQGKGARLPSPPNKKRAPHPLHTLSIDLWGPAATPSLGGNRYFLTIYDDFSHRLSTFPLKAKSQAAGALKDFIAHAENQLSTTVKRIISDRGGEFMTEHLRNFFRFKGISHTLTPPAAHAQNGRVERAHLTLLNDVRTLLLSSGLPPKFWAHALDYATYTRNRVFLPDKDSCPEDLWLGTTVPIGHLQPFGATAMVRVHEQQGKLNPRYVPARLMGYQTGTTNYRLLLTQTGKITFSRDVIFSSSTPPAANPPAPADTVKPDNTTPSPDGLHSGCDSNTAPPLSPSYASTGVTTNNAQPPTPPHSDSGDSAPRGEEELELDPEPQVRGWHYEPDPRFQRDTAPSPELGPEELPTGPADLPAGPRRSSRYTGRPIQYSVITSLLTDNLETLVALAASTQALPTSYLEARQSNEWEQWEPAFKAELDNMEKYGVWEPVPRLNQRTLPGKWVLTRKIDGSTGKPSKYKARWVIKGFRQIAGQDYGDLFAAVAHKDSIRVVLSLINYLDMECDQVDIKGAFLNGDIDRELFVEPPDGSDIPANQVLRLRKSIYGLKQSPRLFNKTLDAFLQSEGLKPSSADSCVYTRRRDGHFLLLAVHVDDQIIACDSRSALDDFKRRLNARFECSNSGPIGYFLGFNVYRDRLNRRLYISQEHYLESLLERYSMGHCSAAKTPLPSTFRATAATDAEHAAVRHLDYPSLAGSILYAATVSRPDLAFAASVLSRYMGKWNEAHYHAAKHCLRYIRGTSDLCLTFDANSAKRLVLGYADADWGGCLETRRSTTGYVFETFGGIAGWKSKRQSTMALSTTQAEVLAVTDATKQAEWLRQFLDDLGMGLSNNQPIPILNDNRGAVLLSNHPHDHGASKHFEIRTGYLRQETHNNRIQIEHVPTVDNKADGLTKSVPSPRHLQLNQKLQIAPRTQQTQNTATNSK